MRPKVLAAIALALLAAPAVPVAADDAPARAVHDILLDAVRAALGAVPPTAVVDAGFGPREVPTEDALAALRALGAPGPAPAPAGGPREDVGVGLTIDPVSPCSPWAGGVSASRFVGGIPQGPNPRGGLEFEPPTVLAAAAPVRCGAVEIATWHGSASARTTDDAMFVSACLRNLPRGAGAWLHSGGLCSEFTPKWSGVWGRVGTMTSVWCLSACSVVDVMFMGVGDPLPVSRGLDPYAPDGAGVIRVER